MSLIFCFVIAEHLKDNIGRVLTTKETQKKNKENKIRSQNPLTKGCLLEIGLAIRHLCTPCISS